MLQQRKSRSKQLWQLAMGFLVAAGLSGLWVAVMFSHNMPSLHTHLHTTSAAPDASASATWVPGEVHDVLLQEIIQNCMQQQVSVIVFKPGSKQAVVTFGPDTYSAESESAAPAAAAVGSCPIALIPLAAADRSIGLCTDAALYMQLLSAWIVPGDPETAQSILQATAECLAGQQQQQQQRAGVPNDKQARQASKLSAQDASSGAPSNTAAAAVVGGAAVLFLEPLYEPWLQWLQAHPSAVAVYVPNFEQVNCATGKHGVSSAMWHSAVCTPSAAPLPCICKHVLVSQTFYSSDVAACRQRP
jgi:hypothetical protein